MASSFRAWVDRTAERLQVFAQSQAGRRTLTAGRRLFLVGVIAWLLYQMTEIGWGSILRSLPGEPLFYLLFLALYFLLPVAEVGMYRLSWDFEALKAFPAFLKKRIFNKDVLGYSGELYFFSWARKAVGESERVIAETIRDNNILSSASSTLIALILLTVFLAVGEFNVDRLLGDDWRIWAGVGAILLLLLTPIALRFRRYLFSMPLKIAAGVFGLQCLRLIVGQVLQIAQWEVVMPEVSMRVWFTFAAASIMLTRIPFLPNQNLVFLGAGVELSKMMDISSADIAGMLLVVSVLDKALNFALFGVASLLERRNLRNSGPDPRVDGTDEAPRTSGPGMSSDRAQHPDR